MKKVIRQDLQQLEVLLQFLCGKVEFDLCCLLRIRLISKVAESILFDGGSGMRSAGPLKVKCNYWIVYALI